MGRADRLFCLVAAAAATVPLLVYWWRSRSTLQHRRYLVHHLSAQARVDRIYVVGTVHQWEQIALVLKKDIESANIKALGFDCEWVTSRRGMHPVALLQLAAPSGTCVLLRLSSFHAMPHSLIEILENRRILKLGVGCLDDAAKLRRDYDINVQGCLDLRNLAARLQSLDKSVCSLSGMAESLLGVTLDKRRHIRCSNWEAPSLSDEQTMYAATDALVAVDLFRALLSQRLAVDVLEDASVSGKATSLWQGLVDSKYKHTGATPKAGRAQNTSKNKVKSYSGKNDVYPSRTQFYHNCEIRAPDNQLLCKTSRHKAEWYLKRHLGKQVGDNPLVVQLNFEPSRRPPTDEDFFLHDKQDICVVCGGREGLNRKYIVPREYRKYLPKSVKEHKIHDVLLLCKGCHFRSGRKDEELKAALAEKCDAPIQSCIEDRELVRVKSAARALLRQYDRLPEGRRSEMWQELRTYLGREEVNTEDLKVILDTKAREPANIHGKKVVDYYMSQGDVSGLERTWRLHFLDALSPSYLPEAWSVDHTSRWPGLDSASDRSHATAANTVNSSLQ